MRKWYLLIIMMLFLTACGKEASNAYSGGMSEKELEEMVEETKKDPLPVMSEKEQQKRSEEVKSSEMEHKIIREYQVSVWDETHTGIKAPAGIICQDNDMLVLDKKDNTLSVLDYSANVLSRTGKSGAGALEFQTPTGLAGRSNIYVIDSENKRIQVLGSGRTYIREINEIQENDLDGADYRSIAVDNAGDIYLAGHLFMERKIVYKPEGGEIQTILNNFYGTVYGAEEAVYAVNRGQVFVEPKKNTLGIGYGKNALFSLQGGQAKQIAELPDNLGILTFCVKGGRIYAVSHTEQAVMCFDMTGEYVETIGMLKDADKNEHEYYIDVDRDGNVFVSRPEKARIDVYQ